MPRSIFLHRCHHLGIYLHLEVHRSLGWFSHGMVAKVRGGNEFLHIQRVYIIYICIYVMLYVCIWLFVGMKYRLYIYIFNFVLGLVMSVKI